MAEFASPEETQRALEKLIELQATDPNGLRGILNKYGNPFTSWPLLKEPTEAFLHFFEASISPSETEPGQQTVNPKLKELVDEFDKEIVEARAGRVKATTASKKYIDALIKNAREARVPMTETQAPAQKEQEGSPVSLERVSEIASAAILEPGSPEQKEYLFHALEITASKQPDKAITELLPHAVSMAKAATILTSAEGALPQRPLSARGTNALQQLGTIVNQFEKIPKNVTQQLVDRLGENFVSSEWFTKFRVDANKILGEQKSAGKIMGRVSSVFTDVGTAIFRGPLDENVIASIETYRLMATQGVHITNLSAYRDILLGKEPSNRTKPAYAARVVFLPGARSVTPGVTAIIGADAQGVKGYVDGQLKKLAFSLIQGTNKSISGGVGGLKNLLNKGVNYFKNVIDTANHWKPKVDMWFIIGIAVLVFLIFILPWFSQDVINTSLATAPETGISNETPVPPPSFGPVNGSITDCIMSQGKNIEGTQTLTLTPTSNEWGRLLNISQTYPMLGCYSKILNCPSTRIDITEFPAASGGPGAYAPSREPGNIIFYPTFFTYSTYFFGRTLAHEMMHEVEWFYPKIYDAFMNGAIGGLPKGYCGPLGTYTAGVENSYETMAEAAGLYVVGNPLLQQKCQPAYEFMKQLFGQCQK
jgi:hypothetical protein